MHKITSIIVDKTVDTNLPFAIITYSDGIEVLDSDMLFKKIEKAKNCGCKKCEDCLVLKKYKQIDK